MTDEGASVMSYLLQEQKADPDLLKFILRRGFDTTLMKYEKDYFLSLKPEFIEVSKEMLFKEQLLTLKMLKSKLNQNLIKSVSEYCSAEIRVPDFHVDSDDGDGDEDDDEY